MVQRVVPSSGRASWLGVALMELASAFLAAHLDAAATDGYLESAVVELAVARCAGGFGHDGQPV
jgi:hypothetical protein